MAESEGFEPSILFPIYTLSRGAPSATRPALQFFFNSTMHCILNVRLIPDSCPWLSFYNNQSGIFLASSVSPFGARVVKKQSPCSDCSQQFSQPLGQLFLTTLPLYSAISIYALFLALNSRLLNYIKSNKTAA